MLNKRGQNTAEYAVLIALVIGAAIAMQTYVKRNLQGGMKYTVDKLQKSGGISQYEPYYLESAYNTTVGTYQDSEQTKSGGEVERVFGSKTTTRSGYQKIKGTSNTTSYHTAGGE